MKDIISLKHSSGKKGFVTLINNNSQRLFFSPFFAALQPVEFPGQESDLSCSCSLSRRNAGSLTHSCRARIEPASQGSQDVAHPIAPEQELLTETFT